jgi:hypothetical protein
LGDFLHDPRFEALNIRTSRRHGRTVSRLLRRKNERSRRVLHRCGFAANGWLVQVRLNRSYYFEAAHRLPNVPPGHKCAQLHGHSYGIDIIIKGPVDPTSGWCVDFAEIDAV